MTQNLAGLPARRFRQAVSFTAMSRNTSRVGAVSGVV